MSNHFVMSSGGESWVPRAMAKYKGRSMALLLQRKRRGTAPTMAAVSNTWSYSEKSPQGTCSIPASRCNCQWRRRSEAATDCNSSGATLPCQNPSTARFNSRRTPIRGKPRFVAMVIDGSPGTFPSGLWGCSFKMGDWECYAGSR